VIKIQPRADGPGALQEPVEGLPPLVIGDVVPDVRADPRVPEMIRNFAKWLDGYTDRAGLKEHPERYSTAHFEEIRAKARDFCLVLHEDGVIEIVKQ
jgi:hypothetical protein